MLHAICSDPTLEFRLDQINESEAAEVSLNEINAAADVRCREKLLLHRMNGWMHSYAGPLLHQFLPTFDQAIVGRIYQLKFVKPICFTDALMIT